MTPLPKHLEAEKYFESIEPDGMGDYSPNQIINAFVAGQLEALKDMESMAKALEKIDIGTGTTSWTDQLIAREALKIWREKYSKQSEGL